jgi:hypothetical protein
VKLIDRFDLSQVERDFAVANTPLFLLRKLRINSEVDRLSRSLDGRRLIHELGRALMRKPRILRNAVRPYVYLVALSKQQDKSLLRRAAALEAPHHPWFKCIADVLLAPTVATESGAFEFPASLIEPKAPAQPAPRIQSFEVPATLVQPQAPREPVSVTRIIMPWED